MNSDEATVMLSDNCLEPSLSQRSIAFNSNKKQNFSWRNHSGSTSIASFFHSRGRRFSCPDWM